MTPPTDLGLSVRISMFECVRLVPGISSVRVCAFVRVDGQVCGFVCVCVQSVPRYQSVWTLVIDDVRGVDRFFSQDIRD